MANSILALTLPPSHPDFKDYVALMESGHFDRLEGKLQFAHPIDGAVIKLLESTVIKDVVSDVIKTAISTQMNMFLTTGITVDPNNYPSTYSILNGCCKTLGISVPHTVITNEVQGMNAMTFGTDDFSFIAIGSLLESIMPKEEQTFVIGHECGHIALGHVVYHTIGNYVGTAGSFIPILGPIVANTVTLPLNAWSRCSEITADRAGLLCCGELIVAQKALMRLVAGFSDISDIDFESYLEQSENSRDVHSIGAFQEYFMQHPIIPKRIKALEYFAHSEMYHRLSGKQPAQGQKLYSDEQLNTRVDKLLKVM